MNQHHWAYFFYLVNFVCIARAIGKREEKGKKECFKGIGGALYAVVFLRGLLLDFRKMGYLGLPFSFVHEREHGTAWSALHTFSRHCTFGLY